MFTRQRLAVFIDGCFWHGCPERATMPATNTDYWRPKLAGNIERDRETNAMAQAEGWKVLRICVHVSPEEAVGRKQEKLTAP
ncbi:very short patch repair endonuclease [Actinomyces gaoshouyii]|uniref:Very short patch repair endonuclease n=1 Tax=Actinomyces gaoshouyii TaxID=1960083 RepID=A0A8H9LE76_9ACTO|nr:very short patch repair endonuclease [Actinomyces gaoshouyii]